MLLRELISHTPEDHVDHRNLSEAFAEVKRVNTYINERQKNDAEMYENLSAFTHLVLTLSPQ